MGGIFLNANQLYGAIDIKNTLCENWVTACSGFIDNDLRSVVFGGQSYDLQQSSWLNSSKNGALLSTALQSL